MILAAMLCVLLRHNGIYALLCTVPFLILRVRQNKEKVLLLSICPLIAAVLLETGMTTALGATRAEHQEMLTVPIQQLARTYAYQPDTFTEEEKEVLFRYLDESALKRYTPRLSDPVKISFNNVAYEADRACFFRLWIEIFRKAPESYGTAWLLTSYGFWYPGAVIDVYEGHQVFTFTYTGSSYFGYETEAPGVRHSLIPPVDDFYRFISLDKTAQTIPVVSLFLSPAFWFFVYAFMCGWLRCRGRKREAAAFLPAFFLWLTTLLGPTYLPRYALIFFFLVPVYPALSAQRSRCYTEEAA